MLLVKTIVKRTKNELVATIITYLRKLDAFIKTDDSRLMTAPEEDIVLTEDEFAGAMPKIRVEVDNSYLDVEERIYETLPISEIVLCEGEFYVRAGDDAELHEDDLTIDELARVAQFLETEWEKTQQ